MCAGVQLPIKSKNEKWKKAMLEKKKKKEVSSTEKIYYVTQAIDDFIKDGGYFEPRTPGECYLLETIRRVELALRGRKSE